MREEIVALAARPTRSEAIDIIEAILGQTAGLIPQPGRSSTIPLPNATDRATRRLWSTPSVLAFASAVTAGATGGQPTGSHGGERRLRLNDPVLPAAVVIFKLGSAPDQ